MADDDLVAFIDESLKPVRHRSGDRSASGQQRSFYAAAAAVVLRGDLEDSRERLSVIAHQFKKGLHYASLSTRQRLAALVAVHELPGWDGLVVETNRPVIVRNDRSLRSAVLSSAMRELALGWGVRQVVIESRAHPDGRFAKLDRDDVLLVARLRELGGVPREMSAEHSSKDELILGLADLLAGARTDWLCGVDRAPWSVVHHRVRLRTVPPQVT